MASGQQSRSVMWLATDYTVSDVIPQPYAAYGFTQRIRTTLSSRVRKYHDIFENIKISDTYRKYHDIFDMYQTFSILSKMHLSRG